MDDVLNSYLLLLGAITFVVIGTLLLSATQGFNKLVPSVLVVGSYGASFYFLSIVVQKFPFAIVYASWAALRLIKEEPEVFENIWTPDWEINQRLEEARLLNDMVRKVDGTSFVQMIVIPIK